MKPSNFSNELLLVFQKNMLFAITLTWPKTVFTKKTLIFSKTSRLNSHKNALNQCKTLNCNETKQFFKRITASFSEKTCYLQSH